MGLYLSCMWTLIDHINWFSGQKSEWNGVLGASIMMVYMGRLVFTGAEQGRPIIPAPTPRSALGPVCGCCLQSISRQSSSVCTCMYIVYTEDKD